MIGQCLISASLVLTASHPYYLIYSQILSTGGEVLFSYHSCSQLLHHRHHHHHYHHHTYIYSTVIGHRCNTESYVFCLPANTESQTKTCVLSRFLKSPVSVTAHKSFGSEFHADGILNNGILTAILDQLTLSLRWSLICKFYIPCAE